MRNLLTQNADDRKLPEGHKTHWIAREHNRRLAGKPLECSSPQGRFRAGARVLEKVNAVGKHLFYQFDGDRILHVHLGRYGKFRLQSTPPPKPLGQIRLRVVADDCAFDLSGLTTCRLIGLSVKDSVCSRLGPDPLGGGKKSEAIANIRASRKSIGALLLDQRVIAGVGNIFRTEILFCARCSAETLALVPTGQQRYWGNSADGIGRRYIGRAQVSESKVAKKST